MAFENVTPSTESITLFTATGLHTFKNLIDLDTLDCDEYDKHLIKVQWVAHLYNVFGPDANAVESFITDHGYMIPQDWFDMYCTFIK